MRPQCVKDNEGHKDSIMRDRTGTVKAQALRPDPGSHPISTSK